MAEQQTNKEQFFSVVIRWDGGEDINQYRFLNCTSQMVHILRRQLFSEGVQVGMTKLDNWQIILPWNIKAFEVYLQGKFFDDHTTVKQTVFDKEQKKI